MRGRVFLYVPADNERMLGKARGVACDGIIYDLEDAVHQSHAQQARDLLAADGIWQNAQGKERLIRVNGHGTPGYEEDLAMAAALRPSAVILPKATPKAVKETDCRLSRFALKAGGDSAPIAIIPLIETTFGLYHMGEILRASARVTAAQFGAEDYTNDMGIQRTSQGDEICFARQSFALACHAAGVRAIDTPYAHYKDMEGLRRDCLAARRCGMQAKACIHPLQIETVREVFAPDKNELAEARRILRVAALPENKGKGAFSLDGTMVDAPVIARAKNLLEQFGEKGDGI